MKIEFVETKYESCFTIYPETAAEVAQLYRMVKNSKSEKPYLYLQFNDTVDKKVYANVSMKKIKDTATSYNTSINGNNT